MRNVFREEEAHRLDEPLEIIENIGIEFVVNLSVFQIYIFIVSYTLYFDRSVVLKKIVPSQPRIPVVFFLVV